MGADHPAASPFIDLKFQTCLEYDQGAVETEQELQTKSGGQTAVANSHLIINSVNQPGHSTAPSPNTPTLLHSLSITLTYLPPTPFPSH